ncbi:helix-turn-helix domain-containing protein [Priestia aryabhattai]|uniref:helix-turn-helix domain-containing protein n=1 Tax=Priestia aryabhattai TaxID=412384 RepID=UPI00138ED72C|nr:helix-turn-helix transcriptional regulator [Priestia megaterium]
MIGEKIKNLRLKQGYSMTRLAEEAHISKSYLCHLEKNLNSNPSLKMLDKIASSLHATIDYFIDPEVSIETVPLKPNLNNEWLQLIEQAAQDGMT